MKKVILIVLVLLVGLILLGVLAKKDAESMQERFFAVVGAGDAQKLIDLMGPELTKNVEAPVLAAWMAGINKGLGEYRGLVEGEWELRNENFDGRECRVAEGRAKFAKGEALVRVVHEDDRLVGFRIDAAEEARGWAEAIDTVPYLKLAQVFLMHLLGREVEQAREAAGKFFQSQVKTEELKGVVERVLGSAGELREVTLKGQRWVAPEDGPVSLELIWDVQMATWRHDVLVAFLIVDFGCRLSGVDLLHGN